MIRGELTLTASSSGKKESITASTMRLGRAILKVLRSNKRFGQAGREIKIAQFYSLPWLGIGMLGQASLRSFLH